MYSTELLKGTLKTIILKLLADNKKMYGYEITQKVKELTLDKISIGAGPQAKITLDTTSIKSTVFESSVEVGMAAVKTTGLKLFTKAQVQNLKESIADHDKVEALKTIQRALTKYS